MVIWKYSNIIFAHHLKAIAEQLRENAELLGKIETIDTGKLFKETKKAIKNENSIKV